MSRTTDFVWHVHGHVPVTFGTQQSSELFGGVWEDAFVAAGNTVEEAQNTFRVLCSETGEEPGTHIVFSTPLTLSQFWYVGVNIATMFGLEFPVQDGDTPDEIVANPDVASFVNTLAGYNIFTVIKRNDLGQNVIDYKSYLAYYNLQFVRTFDS